MRHLLPNLPICVDGRSLGAGGTGVATYARGLLDGVERLSERPYLLCASHENDPRARRWWGALAGSQRVTHQAVAVKAGPGRLIGHDLFRRAHIHFGLFRHLLPLRCDLPFGIMHWSYPVPLVMENWINIYSVHDAIPLNQPDLSPISRRRHRSVLQQISKRASRLVTVSDHARTEIVVALGCDPAMVVNCGQSVQTHVPDTKLSDIAGAALGYFLFCGSIEPRKNLSALLSAYRASGVANPLFIVGPDGWRAAPILKEIEATPGAVRSRYATRQELLRLISGARALLFPSLAEGYGLPVIEAMALGTAVMTSNRGALAEVAGGAALLVDPDDQKAMTDGIVRLATDDVLGKRLIELGRDRAKAFSPEVFVEKLADVYDGALSQRFRPSAMA